MGNAAQLTCYLLIIVGTVNGVPVPKRDEKDVVLMPVPATRIVQIPITYYNPQSPQTRGPFEFIGQWIQQNPFFPVQVNIPDLFQNIGNGINQATTNVQQLSQNVGSGVSQFTQNVGTGFNQITQNVGNGFNQWMQQIGQRVPLIGNMVTSANNRVPSYNGQPIMVVVPVRYPGGQELVLEEALDAFP